MSTVQHKVEMHRLASARRAAGKPVWDHTIKIGHVWRNDEYTFEQRRAEIVACVRRSSWYKTAVTEEDSDLVELVENLATEGDVEEWDCLWDEFYDLADHDRVWIDISPVST
jgi:hypothetical protein